MALTADKNRLKTLFLDNRSMRDPFAGGGEIHLHMLADRLSDIGRSVTYVCREYRRHGISNDNDRVREVTLRARYFALCAVSWYCVAIALVLSFLEYAIVLFYKETTVVTGSEDAKSELTRLGITAEHIFAVLPDLARESG